MAICGPSSTDPRMPSLSTPTVLTVLLACASLTACGDPSGSVQGTPQLDITLDLLKDRSAYAQLNKAGVEALALQAQTKWPAELDNFELRSVEKFSAGGESHWLSIWSHHKTELEFVLVPGGRFQMGSPSEEWSRKGIEQQNWVELDPFLVSRTECTQAAWSAVAASAQLNTSPSKFHGSSDLPVETVSPEEADRWCQAAGLSLPTEAQWEYACRAGTTTTWSMSGDKSDLSGCANLGSLESPQERIDLGLFESWSDGYGHLTSKVGTFKPNAFGLFDVHGNVSEWVRDGLSDYLEQPTDRLGLRPGQPANRVYRGGNFGSNANGARSAFRWRSDPDDSSEYMGLRPSLDLPL